MTIQSALARMQNGDFIGAQQLCRALLAQHPDNFQAHLILGAALYSAGALADAIESLNKAHRLNSNNPDVFVNRGLARQALGDAKAAVSDFTMAMKLAPNFAAAPLYRAQAFAALGAGEDAMADYAQAGELYRVALNSNRNDAQAAMMSCACFLAAGRLHDCIEAADLAIRLAPKVPENWSNRGAAHMSLDNTELALADFDEALRLRPAYPEAHCNRGSALRQMSRPIDALAAYDSALALRPAFPDALSGRGLALVQLGRLAEGKAACEAALRLAPQHAVAWNNLGLALQQSNQDSQALDCFQNALRFNPGLADALYNRGLVFFERKDFLEAVRDFNEARALKPILQVPGQLLHAMGFICDWTEFDQLKEVVTTDLKRGLLPIAPLQLLAVTDEPALTLICARERLAHFAESISASRPAVRPFARAPLRVAFVSADFRDHPCSVLLAPLIETLDRIKITPIGINIGLRDTSAIGARICSAFDEFHECANLTDEDIASRIRAIGADIAVDLMGHTRFARSRVFFFRPAPVQALYLGFPATSGSSAMDYIIADPITAPMDAQEHYIEALCQLPYCYLPTNPGLVIDPTPQRSSLGLPQDNLVFASFNQPWKVTPAHFDIWMRILGRTPGSVLWLSAGAPITEANLRKEAAYRGVDPDRLVFASRVDSQAAHLGRLRAADLFLDTAPYTSHSTACDSLLAHVPLVTLIGRTFAGRVAASVVSAHGFPELIANTPAAYEDLAVALGTDRARLAALRKEIARAIPTSPLFDVKAYAEALEDAFEHMVRNAALGLAPAAFSVSAPASRPNREVACS